MTDRNFSGFAASNAFPKKGYGRIYVADPQMVERVHEIVEAIDPSEYSGYYPTEHMPGNDGLDVIAPFPEDGKVRLIYLHKFETCMDAIALQCWREGIPVWVIGQGGHGAGDRAEEFRAQDKLDATKSDEIKETTDAANP